MCFNRRNHFRYDDSKAVAGHPTYIYAKIADKYKRIGLTHAPITDGMKNIPLEKNPQPGKTERSYLRPKAGTDRVSDFGPKLKGWKLKSKNDKKTVRQIISNSKK